MKNKYLSKTKFINAEYGKKEKHYFILPSIFYSKQRKISWDLLKSSITIVFLNYYYQINLFNIIKDFSKEVYKQDVANIVKILKENNKTVSDFNLLVKYVQNNDFLVTVVKNLTVEHPYCRKVIYHHLKDCEFITNI